MSVDGGRQPTLTCNRDTRVLKRAEPRLVHNKLAVVEDTLITGSFNFSNNATQNAENLLQIESKAIADHYAAYIAVLTQKYPEKGL